MPSVKSFAVPMGSGSGAGQSTIKDVACHTSINAVEDLSDILQDEMGAFKMHRTKCTAVIKSVLAKEDIGESPYSLYLDETTDISVSKLLCICVKYRSQKHSKFVSTYLGLVELLKANANGISDAIVAFLGECGLNIKNMVGIATDGTSVMVRKKSLCFHATQTKTAESTAYPLFATHWISLLTKLCNFSQAIWNI